MQIDKLAISTQPRTSWQAFDLGCRMALEAYRPLCLAWLAVSFPFFVLANLISIEFASLIVWWFKPWYETALLYILSRRVFGQQVTLKDAITHWPGQLKPQWLASISWRRLSVSRGFDLAVTQLEGQQGEARKKRLGVLHRTSDDNTGWWLIICVHWEMFIVIGIVSLLYMLIPDGLPFDNPWVMLLEEEDGILVFCYNLIVYLAWMLVAPFYLGGAFAAYLNRRMVLEGWDIEMQFRQMSQQLAKPASHSWLVLLLCSGLWFGPADDVMAQQTSGQTETQVSAQTIAEDNDDSVEKDPANLPEAYQSVNETLEGIMNEPPFQGKEIEKRWRWVGWTWEPDTSTDDTQWDLGFLKALFAMLALSAEFILWGIAGIIIVVLLWLTRHHIARLFQFRPSASPQILEMPSFTQAENPDGLPSDIHASISQYVQAGEYRQALSLMLISSLMDLCFRQNISLTSSMTEKECLQAIEQKASLEQNAFMQQLMESWIRLAWAHQPPSAERINILWHDWNDVFPAISEADNA